MNSLRRPRGRGPGICKEVLPGRVPDAVLRAWLRPHRLALEDAGFAADWRRFPTGVSRRTLAGAIERVLQCDRNVAGHRTARLALMVVDQLCRSCSRGTLLVALLGRSAADQGMGRAEIAIRLWLVDPELARELAGLPR